MLTGYMDSMQRIGCVYTVVFGARGRCLTIKNQQVLDEHALIKLCHVIKLYDINCQLVACSPHIAGPP
jgi:hypothetical protein